MENEKMIQIWYYDLTQGGIYQSTGLVPANHVLEVGETFIRPEDGLHWPIYFVPDKQRWIGTPEDQWENPRPETKVEATPEQTAMAGLMKDVAELKNDKGQDEFNANLLKQVAQLKLENTQQTQLNARLMKRAAQAEINSNAQAQINANAMKDIATLKIKLEQMNDQPESWSNSTSTSLSLSPGSTSVISTSVSQSGIESTSTSQVTNGSLSVSLSQSESNQMEE